MQRIFSRLARGAELRIVAGALAAGLLVSSPVAGQQGETTPAAKKPAGRASGRAAKSDSPAPTIRARIVNRSLAGADEGPVFLDVEADTSFTLPADLVPAEDRGKSIENWVFPDPLKAWIRRQGIDFAFQTDGRSHVAVVGFDVRTGPPESSGDQRFSRRIRTLDPWRTAKSIQPAVLETAKWNFTKNYSQYVPFVTREGSLGIFTVAIEPYRAPGSVDIICDLSQDPDLVKLTGQPVLPPVDSPLSNFFKPGVLVADVIDQKLRLRLLGTPHEIVVGGGEVLVRGPAGVALRAARLEGARLKLDGVKEVVTFSLRGRGSPPTLRRAGRHVQIEMIGRVAETVRLELKMPELEPVKTESLAWQLAPLQIDDRGRANRSPNRQQLRAERARRLAEMAKHGYALKPGESVGHVPLPFPAAREEYWCAVYPNQYFPMSIRTGPATATYKWDGKELHEDWQTGDRLSSLVDALHGVKTQELSGPADLLEKSLPGDWVVRPDVPDEVFAREFEAVLRRDFRLPIHVEFRQEPRDLYVATGHFHFTPLEVEADRIRPRAARKPEPGDWINIFGKRMYPGTITGGGGSGDFKECLKWVGWWIETPIVNEVTDAPDEISWRLHATFGPRPKSQRSRRGQIGTDEDHDPALVLANIERQTGVHFTKERRPVKMLVVEKKD